MEKTLTRDTAFYDFLAEKGVCDEEALKELYDEVDGDTLRILLGIIDPVPAIYDFSIIVRSFDSISKI